ncbi:hypothetical protein HU200_006277 [Digitaria exilis]|uniref:Uncharacterized protein n=1 Tax=Digitaria exilis TaxID=1010633 RepID=A0A835FSE9_9POAL|nr:hypothetical protein HU200_006277 [Digitaria exilis]CAB3446037.1 unnamed protein product [Digitaria exilis]
MAGLQRSAQTFRRSGSSGLVWDERFLTELTGDVAAGGGGARGPPRRQPELRHSRSVGSLLLRRGDEKRMALAKPKHSKDQQKQKKQQEEGEVVGPGRKAFRTRDVAPAAEPPSPRLPGCWGAPCAIFRSSGNGGAGSASVMARRPNNNKPRKR